MATYFIAYVDSQGNENLQRAKGKFTNKADAQKVAKELNKAALWLRGTGKYVVVED
jgi:hypothetical protein